MSPAQGHRAAAYGYIEETPVASAARTASGNSGAQSGYGPSNTLIHELHITAASGTTPTLDVVLEETIDGVNWFALDTFPQQTTAGQVLRKVTVPFLDRVRWRWTVGGTTPSFTFEVIVATQTTDS